MTYQTPAQTLGYAVGQKFVVVDNTTNFGSGNSNSYIEVGDIVTFIRDDDTFLPLFRKKSGKEIYINLKRLKPLEETTKMYTREQIVLGLEAYGWCGESVDDVLSCIDKATDPDYKKYLQLKQKFQVNR